MIYPACPVAIVYGVECKAIPSGHDNSMTNAQ